jgi:hypothetical protein
MKTEIENYAKEIQTAYKNDKFWGGENGEKADKHTFSVEFGRKFARIVHTNWGQRSVHCFVDIKTGDILKSAGWSTPAKGVRGNLANEKRPLFSLEFYNR